MLNSLIFIVISILAFIPVLCVIVFVHEYGHFRVARWCGIKVDVFSIGFGKVLWSKVDKHGTEWRISALPLGGFVKFFGDANAASMPDKELTGKQPPKPSTTQFPKQSTTDILRAKLTKAEQAVCFHFKPVWQRAAVVAAGPIANFLLTIVFFYVLLLAYGTQPQPATIQEVMPDRPAAAAGFEPGDVVLSIDGRKIKSSTDLQVEIILSSGETLNVMVLREGREVMLTVTPERTEVIDRYGNPTSAGQIGVALAPDIDGARYNVVNAAPAAVRETGKMIAATGRSIWRLVTLKEDPRQLGGPIQMAKMAGQTASSGFDERIENISFWERLEVSLVGLLGFAAMISLSIGFLNLLPVPLLDGGHLMYYAYEAVAGKPLNEKIQAAGFRVGIAILGTLMVFVFFNDILRQFS